MTALLEKHLVIGFLVVLSRCLKPIGDCIFVQVKTASWLAVSWIFFPREDAMVGIRDGYGARNPFSIPISFSLIGTNLFSSLFRSSRGYTNIKNVHNNNYKYIKYQKITKNK